MEGRGTLDCNLYWHSTFYKVVLLIMLGTIDKSWMVAPRGIFLYSLGIDINLSSHNFYAIISQYI